MMGNDSEKKGETFIATDAKPGTPANPGEAHNVDFSALCLSLATGAMIQIGATPDPASNKIEKNLNLAKQNIQILELLQVKTKGNCTPEEDHLLTALLTEVRLRFVEATKS